MSVGGGDVSDKGPQQEAHDLQQQREVIEHCQRHGELGLNSKPQVLGQLIIQISVAHVRSVI